MRPELIDAPYLDDPSQWLEEFSELPHIALLDSCHFGGTAGRYHIITGAPKQWLTVQAGLASISDNSGKREIIVKDANQCWELIAELADERRYRSSLPFCGGLLGFLGYEFGVWSVLGTLPSGEIDFPDLAVGNFRWALVQDNHTKTATLSFLADCDIELKKQLKEKLKTVQKEDNNFILNNKLYSDLPVESYFSALQRIQAYIAAGDCYQVNYTQRFSARLSVKQHSSIYRTLRRLQSGPMAAYIAMDSQRSLISLSPERLVSCSKTHVLAQPIKGTIKRSPSPIEDQALSRQLQASEKDRAENLMIVDLLRNDMGRVCAAGSIQVPSLFELQSFENVHHLVSTVSGKLLKHLNALDLLRACFPGGSITGAPKYRAMQIIEELEPHRRSAYCGTVFYWSANDNFDSSITIRTLVATSTELFCWGGGGITADSDPESEYQESITKISKLIDF